MTAYSPYAENSIYAQSIIYSDETSSWVHARAALAAKPNPGIAVLGFRLHNTEIRDVMSSRGGSDVEGIAPREQKNVCEILLAGCLERKLLE